MKEITREELYNQVWQKPMSKLAPEYGLSDVGLAKICKKHHIPRPPRGYWARLAAGQKVPRTRLPSTKDNQTIRIDPSNNNCYSNVPNQSDNIPELEAVPDIVVPASLRSPHPKVQESLSLLELSKDDSNGFVKQRSGTLDIHVTRKLLKRALRIMDALVRSAEEQGYKTVVRKKETWIKLLDEEIKISLSEELDSQKVESSEENFDGYYQFRHKQFEYEKVPSGRLCLSIDEIEGYYIHNSRRTWRDTKTKNLENQLTNFFKGLIKLALKKKAHDAEQVEKERQRLEMQRQREEQEKIRKDLRILIDDEKERVSRLLTDSENRHRSRLIREFVEEVDSRILDQLCSYEPAEDFESWKEWAIKQADRIDPLVQSPESVLDQEQDLIEAEKEAEEGHYYRWNR